MKAHYIYHSGFLVETAACNYIFDYWKGELPPTDPAKPVVVLSSHAHQDHYEPAVFDLLKRAGVEHVTAVLSSDIPTDRHPTGVEVHTLRPRKTLELPCCKVEALLSTDCGVAFLVTTEEGVIYHAGDLNDWYWEGEPEENNAAIRMCYRREIGRLRGRAIDLAFVPFDTRLDSHAGDGMEWFLEQTEAAAVYPMHYWDQPQAVARFLADRPQYEGRLICPER